MNEFTSDSMEVTCREVRTRLDAEEDFLLLDCREPHEYEIVAIAPATLLPMSQIEQRLGELEEHRERDIVIHCHHGGRSLQVAAWLRAQGFSKAFSMAGGIHEWAIRIDPSLPTY